MPADRRAPSRTTRPSSTVSRETSSPEAPAPVRIAVINQKGGVGKTTTAVSLAADLASRGWRTLLIDMDSQGNATTALGVDRNGDAEAAFPTSYDLLFGKGAEGLEPHVVGEGKPDLYGANLELVSADLELVQLGTARNRILKGRIDQLMEHRAAAGHAPYDFIIFDSPPSLGILTINILIASSHIIIPIQCEYLALEGLSKLVETVRSIRQQQNRDLRILGCLVTMTDLRTNLSQQVVAEVRGKLGDLMFEAMIPRTVRLAECPSHGQTIFEYERWGAGARSYRAMTDEVLARVGRPAQAPTVRYA